MALTSDFICFVDIGISSIKIGVIEFKKKNDYKILYLEKQELNFIPNKLISVFNRQEVFDILALMINKIESFLKCVINNVVLITKEDSTHYLQVSIKNELRKYQKINSNILESFIKEAIVYFNNKDSKTKKEILDIINFQYRLDDGIVVKNAYNITASSIIADIGVIGMGKKVINNFNLHLEKFKIRPMHFILSNIAICYLFGKEEKSDKNNLFINFGANNTSYLIVRNNTIVYSGAVKFGSFDITRDIDNFFNINNIEISEKLKLQSEEYSAKSLNSVINVDLINNSKLILLSDLFDVTNARIKEIFTLIQSQVFQFNNEIKIEHIVITGSAARIVNLRDMLCVVFGKEVTINVNPSLDESDRKKLDEININPKQYVYFYEILGAVKFFEKNRDRYKKLAKGMIFKKMSKITCLLRELIY